MPFFNSVSYLIAMTALVSLVRTPLALAQDFPMGPNDRNQMAGNSHTGSLVGRIVFSDGREIYPQVLVTIQSAGNGFSCNVLADSSGHFAVEDLPYGTYIVSVEESGYTPTSATTFVGGVHGEVALNLHSFTPSSSASPSVSVHELEVPGKARDLFEKGVQHLQKQDDAGSVRLFKQAIEKYRTYYEAYYCLGVAQAHLGQVDAAVNSFQSAIDLSDGRYSRAEFAYAAILADRGNIADAERLTRDGLDKDQSLPDGFLVMAIISLRQNRLDEAEKNARDALARSRNFANAYLILAKVHSEKKDFGAEMKDLDTYLNLQPNSRNAQQIRELRATAQRLANDAAAKQAEH